MGEKYIPNKNIAGVANSTPSDLLLKEDLSTYEVYSKSLDTEKKEERWKAELGELKNKLEGIITFNFSASNGGWRVGSLSDDTVCKKQLADFITKAGMAGISEQDVLNRFIALTGEQTKAHTELKKAEKKFIREHIESTYKNPVKIKEYIRSYTTDDRSIDRGFFDFLLAAQAGTEWNAEFNLMNQSKERFIEWAKQKHVRDELMFVPYILSQFIAHFKPYLTSETALQIIELGRAEFVLTKPDLFPQLDKKTVVEKLVETNQLGSFDQNNYYIGISPELDLKIMRAVIEYRSEYNLNLLKLFDVLKRVSYPVDYSAVGSILEKKHGNIIIANLDLFPAYTSAEWAEKFINAGFGRQVFKNLSQFQTLRQKTFESFVAFASGDEISPGIKVTRFPFDNFSEKDLEEETEKSFINKLFLQANAFSKLDYCAIALRFIELKLTHRILDRLELFIPAEAIVFFTKVETENEANFLANYIKKLQTTPPEAALFIEKLQAIARSLITAEPVSQKTRKDPGYTLAVKYTFPSGDYSSYTKNLTLKDKSEHLVGYTFEHTGYPIELSGLQGYAIKNGELEDPVLLATYQDRLLKIKRFIDNGDQDYKSLQKNFDKKVSTLFEQYGLDVFKALPNLSPKEQMLALFISEAYRGERPHTEVLDLIIEYKYTYNENLGAYIQRSADGVKSFKDDASRRRALWGELSTIYGENLKHVLRHDIHDSLKEDSKHYDDIMETYAKLFEQSKTALNSKQQDRIRNTFNNDNIQMEDSEVTDSLGKPKKKPGKLNVLRKQIQEIAGANVTFTDKEEEEKFNRSVDVLFNDLKDNFTESYFNNNILPKLLALRTQYRFNITTKLEQFFSQDINAINRELTKYEEIIEIDKKEIRQGGPRDKVVKKSMKKRRVRSFFMKTRETSNARMGAYLCIAGDKEMWDNKNYFELVMKDEETDKCVGTVMLLVIQSKGGRYLWFGPNPFEGFLDQVDTQKCYDYLVSTIQEFADKNTFDGVVIPAEEQRIIGECTNRGGNFPRLIWASRLLNDSGQTQIVSFDEKHVLGKYKRTKYSYEQGALIWKREKNKKNE